MSEQEQTIEQKASAMGWVPKDQFRGDPEKWVDAETYHTRGTEILPIVRKNNEKLQQEVTELRTRLTTSEKLLQESQQTIEDLKELRTEINLQKAKDQKAALVSGIAKAREDGDVEQEILLTEQLGETSAAIRAAEKKPEEKKAPEKKGEKEAKPSPADSPVFKSWLSDNPWFQTDERRTSVAMAIAQELRSKPENKGLTERAFLDKVTEEVEKTLGSVRSNPDKVDGGRTSSSGTSQSRGKSYADLPPEAKAACDRFAKRLSGPGKAYKDEAAYQAWYVKQYFEE